VYLGFGLQTYLKVAEREEKIPRRKKETGGLEAPAGEKASRDEAGLL